MWHTRIWNVWSDAVKVNLIYQKQKSKKSAEKIFYFWWPQFVMNQMEVPVPPILLTMVVPVLDSPTYLVVVAALEPTTWLLLLMQCSVPKSSRTNIQAIILDNNLTKVTVWLTMFSNMLVVVCVPPTMSVVPLEPTADHPTAAVVLPCCCCFFSLSSPTNQFSLGLYSLFVTFYWFSNLRSLLYWEIIKQAGAEQCQAQAQLC